MSNAFRFSIVSAFISVALAWRLPFSSGGGAPGFASQVKEEAELAEASAAELIRSDEVQPQLPTKDAECAEISADELLKSDEAQPELTSSGAMQPQLIPLRRESVPVKRKGKVVSFRTSYSGVVTVGTPVPGSKPQEFRVVFDTGSGHLILPSAECGSEACAVHLQYNQSASSTAVPINVDGSVVRPGKMCDQVNIGFGTGKVKGELARDIICLGPPPGDDEVSTMCVTMNAVMAIEMSTMPFKSFGFDGILGMGLSSLALSKDFSFFDIFSQGGTSRHHFGVFLTEGEDGEESEIAIGGHNPDRTLSSLAWADVQMPDMGYWQVEIIGLRVGQKRIDICSAEAPCRGVVDTGTSHLGIPGPYDAEVAELLTVSAGEMLDCRLADLPELVIELKTVNITLHPDTYMRRLPLREDVNVDSKKGVTMPEDGELEKSETTTTTTTTLVPPEEDPNDAPGSVPRFCRPRLIQSTCPHLSAPIFSFLANQCCIVTILCLIGQAPRWALDSRIPRET
jgi:hypothetical protein